MVPNDCIFSSIIVTGFVIRGCVSICVDSYITADLCLMQCMVCKYFDQKVFPWCRPFYRPYMLRWFGYFITFLIIQLIIWPQITVLTNPSNTHFSLPGVFMHLNTLKNTERIPDPILSRWFHYSHLHKKATIIQKRWRGFSARARLRQMVKVYQLPPRYGYIDYDMIARIRIQLLYF